MNTKKVKKFYPNRILMEKPSHSFTARSMPGNFFIAFRISLVLLVHFPKPTLFLKLILPFFQKGYLTYLYTLLFSLCSRNNSPEGFCVVISGAIDIFWCESRCDFLQKMLDKITRMWRHPILGQNIFAGIFYWEQETFLFLIIYNNFQRCI